MICFAILFVTTVISVVHSDEAFTKDHIKTVDSTEMLMEIITDNNWAVDEKKMLIDGIEAPTPAEIITDDDWDPTYTENTVIPTEMPSAIITDDDWDSTFDIGDLLMDEKRMLQALGGNVTSDTQSVELNTIVCSEVCEDTANNVESNSAVAAALIGTIEETTTATVTSVDYAQGPCNPCQSGRFLQNIDEGPGGNLLSAILTITITLDEAVPTEGLLEAIIESPSFAEAKDSIEEATDGQISDVEVSLTTAPTTLPTQEPTALPTTVPTHEPTNQSGKNSKKSKTSKTSRPTRVPTNAPTNRSGKNSKKSKGRGGKSGSKSF